MYSYLPLKCLVPSALVLIALFLGVVPAFAQETPTAIRLNAAQTQAIERGEVITRLSQTDSVNRGEVIGIIQDPIDEIWPMIQDCGSYADWREAITDTGVIERQDGLARLICKGTAKVPFPARDRRGHFQVINNKRTVGGTESHVSTYKYIEGSGNLEDMHGYWLLQPYGADNKHTLVKFVLNVDIGGWLPDFLVRWATRRVLPDTVHGLRKHLGEVKNKGLNEPTFWIPFKY